MGPLRKYQKRLLIEIQIIEITKEDTDQLVVFLS